MPSRYDMTGFPLDIKRAPRFVVDLDDEKADEFKVDSSEEQEEEEEAP